MKIFTVWCVFFLFLCTGVSAQRIVVDSSFASNYRKQVMLRPEPQATLRKEEVESIGDLVSKIGNGIWQRLKYRLNLEGMQESIEAKREQYIGKREEETEKP